MNAILNTIVNKLLQFLGIALSLVAGAMIYRLAVPDAFTSDGAALALVLGALLLVGAADGLLLRSWLALALGPAAFVVGFVAQATVFADAHAGEAGAALAALAGGVSALGFVFTLALLSCILALGTGGGLVFGMRTQRRLAAHRRARRAARLAAERWVKGEFSEAAPERERELAGAHR